MALKLVYWDLRGLGEPIRYMLRYSDLEWEEERLTVGMEGYGTWLKYRDAPDMVVPNLPFLVDGDKKISQTLAIARHVARKAGLMPSDADDLLLCEMVEQEIMDLRGRLTTTCYDPYKVFLPDAPKSETGKHDFEHLKAAFIKRLNERLPKLEPLFAKGFLLGDKLSYADFLVYEFLDQFKNFSPDSFNGFDNVNTFMEKFEGLKGVKEWQQGETYKAGQNINAPIAVWFKK